jgi:antitoxin component YwqK of YwqJK toxin-antitoxin module
MQKKPFLKPGKHWVRVTVTDSSKPNALTETDVVNIDVVGKFEVVLTPDVKRTKTGAKAAVKADIKGGVPPFTLSWSSSKGPGRTSKVNERADTFSETFEKIGAVGTAQGAWVKISVVDSTEGTPQKTAAKVDIQPAEALSVRLEGPDTLQPGEKSSLNIYVSGGVPPYSVSVSGKTFGKQDVGPMEGAEGHLPFDAPSKPCSETLTVVVTDKEGGTASASHSFDVGKSAASVVDKSNPKIIIKREFYEDGKTLLAEYGYLEGDKDTRGYLQGPYTRWWKNGKLHFKTAYKMDKQDGAYESWDENGKPMDKGVYKDDEREGTWTTWPQDKPGAKFEREYKAGDYHGVVKRWNTSGVLICEETYADGVRNGPLKRWFDSGKLSEEGSYAAGKQTGTWKYWQESRQLDGKVLYWLNEEATYRNDVRNGPYRNYYVSGRLVREGNYVNGNNDGVWKEWCETDYEGKSYYFLISECIYKNGSLDGEKRFKEPWSK